MESLKASSIEGFRSEPLVLPSASSISEVIGVLQNKSAYQVFIENGSKCGIITLREILKVSDITNTRAASLAIPVSKLSVDETVARAARLMSDYRVRALPTGNEKRIDGSVQIERLCESLLSIKEFRQITIDKIMSRNLVNVNKSESVSKARNLMLRNGIDHLPVLDQGKTVGILLSSQIVASMYPRERLGRDMIFHERANFSDFRISGFMDTNVLSSEPDERAADVLRKMTEQRKTYSLVKFGDELQGIITYRDYVGFLAEPEKIDVPAYIVGLPEDPFEAELARVKFFRESMNLRKAFPEIQEIRSAIKSKQQGGRTRYEVSVSVSTPWSVRSYAEGGYDLPLVFDRITSRMKRLLAKRPSKRKKGTLRKVS